VGSETAGILVDVGLSLPKLLKRMASAEIAPESINAIVVTHEHTDHIQGVASFVKKYGCKVWVHEKVEECFDNRCKVETFNGSFEVGDIVVDYFPVPHDSKFCVGYTFEVGDAKISVTTDLGSCPEHVFERMRGSQIVLIECNHCTSRLQHNVVYPTWLKRRIAGSKGHLSNMSAAAAVYRLSTLGVQQVVLGHLSAENNSPTLAYSTVVSYLAKQGVAEGVDIFIDVATQDQIGGLYVVD